MQDNQKCVLSVAYRQSIEEDVMATNQYVFYHNYMSLLDTKTASFHWKYISHIARFVIIATYK